MQTYQLVIASIFVGATALVAIGGWYTKRTQVALAAGALATVGLVVVIILGLVDPKGANDTGEFSSTLNNDDDDKLLTRVLKVCGVGTAKAKKTCVQSIQMLNWGGVKAGSWVCTKKLETGDTTHATHVCNDMDPNTDAAMPALITDSALETTVEFIPGAGQTMKIDCTKKKYNDDDNGILMNDNHTKPIGGTYECVVTSKYVDPEDNSPVTESQTFTGFKAKQMLDLGEEPDPTELVDYYFPPGHYPTESNVIIIPGFMVIAW